MIAIQDPRVLEEALARAEQSEEQHDQYSEPSWFSLEAFVHALHLLESFRNFFSGES